MVNALFVCISPEIDQCLELEVARLKKTKSFYMRDLLKSALMPRDLVAFFKQMRSNVSTESLEGTPQTDHTEEFSCQFFAARSHLSELLDTVGKNAPPHELLMLRRQNTLSQWQPLLNDPSSSLGSRQHQLFHL